MCCMLFSSPPTVRFSQILTIWCMLLLQPTYTVASQITCDLTTDSYPCHPFWSLDELLFHHLHVVYGHLLDLISLTILKPQFYNIIMASWCAIRWEVIMFCFFFFIAFLFFIPMSSRLLWKLYQTFSDVVW